MDQGIEFDLLIHEACAGYISGMLNTEYDKNSELTTARLSVEAKSEVYSVCHAVMLLLHIEVKETELNTDIATQVGFDLWMSRNFRDHIMEIGLDKYPNVHVRQKVLDIGRVLGRRHLIVRNNKLYFA